MQSIRVVLGFDMETDVGSWTPFYHGIEPGTAAILSLLRRHRLPATFYFTGDAARKNPKVVRRVRDAGHEIGCHTLFHETVGDPLFDIPGSVPILPEEVEHRLRLASKWVADAAGTKPVSFRAPRLFGSTAMVNALESLGYATDASYPMYHFKQQLGPYHPSRTDWTRPGRLRILELPNFADLAMKSSDPFGRDRDQWPLYRTKGAAALMAHIDSFCAYSRKRGTQPFLCFYFHPWEFHEMPKGEIHYGEGAVHPDPFIVKNTGARAAKELDRLLGLLLDRGATFFEARQIAGLC